MASRALAAEGVSLFRQERFEDAVAAFSRALSDAGDLSTEDRARLLNNRGSAWLRLDRPLDALVDSDAAAVLVCDAEQRSTGHLVPASPLLKELLVKTLTLRVKAFVAAGCPLAAVPLAAAAVAHGATQLRETRDSLMAASAPSPTRGAGVVAGQCERLALDTARTPPARVQGVSAVVNSKLFLMGGMDEQMTTLEDWWVLDCTPRSGKLRWQSLDEARIGGGPRLSRDDSLLAAGSEATSELIVLSEARLLAYDAAGARGWRRVTEKRIDKQGLPDAALAVADGFAYVYSAESRASLRRVSLATGEVTELCKGAGGPRAQSPLMWPTGGGGLLLWGGGSMGEESPPGLDTLSPPPLDAMWAWEPAAGGGRWRQLPNGGGGAPPPPRTEASLVLLGGDGSALLVAGYSEVLPLIETGAVHGYRYLSDTHLYSPGAGWRRVALEPRPRRLPRLRPPAQRPSDGVRRLSGDDGRSVVRGRERDHHPRLRASRRGAGIWQRRSRRRRRG